ncbi:MAG: cell division protein FtsH, partial [Candidatus Marinimicrobia bacterium]|nr:cell division protein FtsH [Candidatus Neomarinimicrobiota bacterium]
LIFNELTTGAGNDLEQATSIARKMVCEWGMSELLGPLTYGKKNEEIFLGREIQTHRDFSEVTARMIDEEVVRIIRKAQRTAKLILKEKVNILHRIAEELLKYETIGKRDIEKILDGKKIVRRNNKKSTQTRKKTHLKSSIRPKTKSTS